MADLTTKTDLTDRATALDRIAGRLESATTRLVESIEAKREYDGLRKDFFSLVDEAVEVEGLLEEVIIETPLGVLPEQIQREMPDYDIISNEDTEEGTTWRLRQNPSLVPYQFVNYQTQQVVARVVTKGKSHLDLNELTAEYPEYEALISETYAVDGALVAQILEEIPELADRFTLMSREIDMEKVNDLAEESPEVISRIEDCTYPTRSSVRMSPLRMATNEELGTM